MTIVNHTSATHSGLLVTGTGDDIEVDLEIVGGRTLRMSASGDELGAWPVDECRIEPDPSGEGSFRLMVEDEDAVFTPADPVSFQALVDRVMATDEDPFGDRPDTELGSAAEDPVAFLFGSNPPPPPATTEMPDFDAAEAGQDWSGPADTETRVDEIRDVAEVQESDEAGDVEPIFDGPEEVETITAGASWASQAEIEELSEPEEPPVVPDVDEVVAERDAAPQVSESMGDHLDDDDDDDVDAEVEAHEGFPGGSALGRLSASIASLRTTDEEVDVEEDDGEYAVGPNTVASDVLETQRSLRQHQLKEMAKVRWMKWGGITIATAAVVALFAFLTPRAIDFLQSYESDIAPPPEVAETTIPPTTVSTTATDTTEETAPVDTTPEALPIGGQDGTIFDRPSPEFISAWDAAGGAIDEVLTFDGFPQLGPFEEQFTPFLTMNGIVQPDGTLDQFTLVIDPTGPSEYDRIGIQALGVAIATVDPERSPEGRASLLGELGLNVRQPLLEGIDGATEVAGIAYTLVYDAAANLLTMTVMPAS